MGTIIVAAVLILAVGAAVYRMYKDKKSGKSLHCGCNCARCGGACGMAAREKAAQRLQEENSRK